MLADNEGYEWLTRAERRGANKIAGLAVAGAAVYYGLETGFINKASLATYAVLTGQESQQYNAVHVHLESVESTGELFGGAALIGATLGALAAASIRRFRYSWINARIHGAERRRIDRIVAEEIDGLDELERFASNPRL